MYSHDDCKNFDNGTCKHYNKHVEGCNAIDMQCIKEHAFKPIDSQENFDRTFIDMAIITTRIDKFLSVYNSRLQGNDYQTIMNARDLLYEALKSMIGEERVNRNMKLAKDPEKHKELMIQCERGIIDVQNFFNAYCVKGK